MPELSKVSCLPIGSAFQAHHAHQEAMQAQNQMVSPLGSTRLLRFAVAPIDHCRTSSDRALPRCSVCEDGFQKCEYPSGPLKPGPKLGKVNLAARSTTQTDSVPSPGSVKRKRKSCHGDCQSQDAGPAPSAMTVAAGGVEQDLHRGSPLINHTPRLSMSRSRSGSEKEPPEPTASPVNLEAVDRDTQQDPKLNVAAISFILHPAHEVTTPEKATENVSLPQAVPSHDEPAIIAGACDALGISSGMLRRL